MRRRWVSFLLVTVAFVANPRLEADHPDVLFIAVDDLNHWVHHLGRNPQAMTPNIDRLAARGVTFRQAYCAAPACNPSRAALMTGRRPTSTGCYTNGDFWKGFIKEGDGLTAQFQKAGYQTAGAGKIYHGDTYYTSEWSEYRRATKEAPAHGRGVQKNEGFHEPLKHDLRDEDLMDWETVDYCIEKLKQPPTEPLFLACGLHKPHLPFAVPRKYYEAFPLAEIQLPPFREDDLDDIPRAGKQMAKPSGDHAQFVAEGRWASAIQSYLATIAYTDMNIGRLLDAIDASPRGKETIIVLWGDHGWHLGEKKHWRKFALWEEATRAPLIFVVPGVTKPGGVCDRTVDFMTIYPTLCDVAGVPTPAHVEGTSIRPLLENPQAAGQSVAVCTHGQGNHAVRTERWRYIRYADGSEELYDHSNDPYEWTNLAGSAHADVMAELRRHLPATEAPVKRGKKNRP